MAHTARIERGEGPEEGEESQVANPISLVPRQGLCPSFVSASDRHKRTERFCAKGAIAKEDERKEKKGGGGRGCESANVSTHRGTAAAASCAGVVVSD